MTGTLGGIFTRLLEELSTLEECREECLRIMEHCFGVRRWEIQARAREIPSPETAEACFTLVARRKTGEPLAHILGYFWFYKHQFPVSPLTLIPRYDTELLVEEALKYKPRRLLDAGTGTGALALSLAAELPQAEIWALDIVEPPFRASEAALGIYGVHFLQQDFLDEASWGGLGSFDLIISNPPYLDDADMERLAPSVKDWEPRSALYGGSDGMVFYRALARFCCTHLDAGGSCLMEVDHKYSEVLEIFKGYRCAVSKDYSGLERACTAKKPPF